MTQLNFINKPIFEHGALKQISEVLRSIGIKKPLICTDKGIVDIGILDNLRSLLSNEFTPTIFDQTPANPTEEAVNTALQLFKTEDCDGIIGLGGGSSIDLGKAVAIMATHEGNLVDFSLNEGGMEKIQGTAPLLAIPTTSGTGSEVSGGSVIIMHDGRKLILASPQLVPDAAICDPDLTLQLPPLLTAGAGMDALTHCIEAILSPMIDPPAEAVGLDGIERVFRNQNLIKAVKDGNNKAARWNMMMAATEGAMAFTKGLGAVHSMSHACGTKQELKLHHGTLNGVILPTVLRFNHGHVGEKYERISGSMGLPKISDLAEVIENLNHEIGLPKNLREMGITEEMIPELSQHSLVDPCTYTNPKIPNLQQYEKLFSEAIG
ncbi:MAG: 4-hydroxybutyrate dehydrogenase [Gammaproteobacteria bacterium]|nr:4-hydroxybutyrate dehydrogenase [Gammaproteobacteria bacterium]